MIVNFDENGYVSNYATVGMVDDGIEVDNPYDLEHFESHFESYHMLDGQLVFDENREEKLARDRLVAEIRSRREVECFPIINRGELWYSRLTESQKEELNVWYQQWLDATSTLVVPEKPEWIN